MSEEQYKWIAGQFVPEAGLIIKDGHPLQAPRQYRKSGIDLCWLSCSRPVLLEKTLSSFVKWFKKFNTYPVDLIKFYLWENSDNKECLEIARKYTNDLGVEGKIHFNGTNDGLYKGWHGLMSMGAGEFVWNMEDDWEFVGSGDLTDGYVDILNSDFYVDGVGFKHASWARRICSNETHRSASGLPYKYSFRVPGTVWGKWGMTILFRRCLLDNFLLDNSGRPKEKPAGVLGEVFIASILTPRINTAMICDRQYFPIKHIGAKLRVGLKYD